LIVILAMRTKERRFERFITDYFTRINDCVHKLMIATQRKKKCTKFINIQRH